MCCVGNQHGNEAVRMFTLMKFHLHNACIQSPRAKQYPQLYCSCTLLLACTYTYYPHRKKICAYNKKMNNIRNVLHLELLLFKFEGLKMTDFLEEDLRA